MLGDAVVLVDTGPLVALFDPSDQDHNLCEEALASLAELRLITSLAVLTEASYLLAFSPRAQQGLIEFISTGHIELGEFTGADLARAGELMRKYSDRPMDLADATLVVLAERLDATRIFTLDEDFTVFRVGRRSFRVIPG